MLYGTMQKRASRLWRMTCVVRRRSAERSMPPCSAIARSRLENFHSVHPRPDPHDVGERLAGDDRRGEQHDLDGEDLAGLDAAAARRLWPSALKFFHALSPSRSRRSLRCHESAGIG